MKVGSGEGACAGRPSDHGSRFGVDEGGDEGRVHLRPQLKGNLHLSPKMKGKLQLKVHLKGPAAEPTDEVYPELHVKPPSATGSDTGCLQEKVQVKEFLISHVNKTVMRACD